MACRLRDYPVLRRAVEGCKQFISAGRITVACPSQDVNPIRFGLRDRATVIPECSLTPEMDVRKFRSANIPFFPQAFGWYYQQILKMNYARATSSSHYLVWDADTIPLRPLSFFDNDGRVLFTSSKEYHQPYFHTYEQLFGQKPTQTSSFISQHILVDRVVMQQLMAEIEGRFQVPDWTEGLFQVLIKSPFRENLFSEYETYVNYFSSRHPHRFAVRSLQWSREENSFTWRVSARRLQQAALAGDHFIALESKNALFSRAFLKATERCNSGFLKRLAILISR